MKNANGAQLREYLKGADVPTVEEAIEKCTEHYAAIEREVAGQQSIKPVGSDDEPPF